MIVQLNTRQDFEESSLTALWGMLAPEDQQRIFEEVADFGQELTNLPLAGVTLDVDTAGLAVSHILHQSEAVRKHAKKVRDDMNIDFTSFKNARGTVGRDRARYRLIFRQVLVRILDDLRTRLEASAVARYEATPLRK